MAKPQSERPTLRPSERELRVFISSVMDDRMQRWRDEAVRVLRNLSPWAFEYTPPSPRSPSSEFLGKVRDADFVIWLVGQATSGPVEQEIRAALRAHGPRLLVFKLPARHRDDKTARLLDQVGAQVKWYTPQTHSDFRKALRLGLRDEIARIVRAPRPPEPASTRGIDPFVRIDDANVFGSEKRLDSFAPTKSEYRRGLVYRSAVLADVKRRLESEGWAMVSGVGASGKTVLAVQVALNYGDRGPTRTRKGSSTSGFVREGSRCDAA